ncbi:ABC transporter substrate-binding protein [Skermanella stibiiresistens SB22]|uniref:ABC transporter substrate-binding protein n=1 Tax=Skermanella stibiiresistens SB22 TaxID=1385369 RepID=W9GVT6_9PROT|nr:ABC transporter substrate-binding protein [Skermanella stibiiresistens]EWY38015.1 ABC transporter substrate-binding protein [Skermanella stibiiresistens SB22]
MRAWLPPVVFSLVLASIAVAAEPTKPAEPLDRIVSVGGAITEIVNQLDLGDRLVAVDSTSQFPTAMRALPQVGYMRALSAEGVVATRPDLVLVSDNAGPPPVIEQIRSLGIPTRMVPDRPTVEGVVEKVRAVGAALGREREAEAMAQRITGDLTAVGSIVASIQDKPRVLFLMGLGRGAPTAAGRNTAADAMITLAGGVNAIDGYEGYKPASGEAILTAAPDVLLLPADAVDSAGGRDAILRMPQFAGTPAAMNGRLVAMDTLYLLGFGPRLPDAIADLARALHPDHAGDFPKPAAERS